MKATEQGNQYCNYCQKETWHTPKLGLVFENKRLCEECHTSNKIEDIKGIINSENSGLSAEQKLKEIQDIVKTKDK